MDEFTKKILKALGIYVAVMLVFLILFQTVLTLSLVPSGSMEDTIMTGDVVISTKTGISEDKIKRFDILIFIPPDEPETTYIKRVVGLPGETIEVKDGKVYADGVELDNSFIKSAQNRAGDGTYTVPEHCFFFIGDNRNNSKDSRFWDNPYVNIDNILAKARIIVFPFSHFASLEYKKEE